MQFIPFSGALQEPNFARAQGFFFPSRNGLSAVSISPRHLPQPLVFLSTTETHTSSFAAILDSGKKKTKQKNKLVVGVGKAGMRMEMTTASGRAAKHGFCVLTVCGSCN